MIEISQPEKIDIANEIARLEAMYKHYKILYRKLMLLKEKLPNTIEIILNSN